MTISYSEDVKEQLRAMAAGRGDGIDLNSKERWVIKGLKNPAAFFSQLNRLIPGDSILYFEGCGVIPELTNFYENNRARNAVPVVRDTIFPVPEMYHVVVTPTVIERLVDLLSQHPVEACFNHVKAYREGKLLFTFHDAFDGSYFYASDYLSEDRIRAFSTALDAVYCREPNVNKRDPEQLRRFLRSLENPHLLRANWPWWKRAIFFWKR